MKKIALNGRQLQVILGLLWIFDGLLQLQTKMFTSSFTSLVISPAGQGQPRFISGAINLAIHIFLFHPAIFNSLVIVTQVGIGTLILFRKSTRLGLILSILWGLIVWYVGEGAGGIFSGHTLLLMGAPGAALIYVLLSLSVLPKKISDKKTTPKNEPAYWLAFVWAFIWVGGAIFQLLPGQNSVSDVSSMIAGNASGSPGWLAYIDNHIAYAINATGSPMQSTNNMHMSMNQMAMMQTNGKSGFWLILLIAAVQIYIGLAVFVGGRYRMSAIASGIVLSLVFWVVGQSFGGILISLATDPNTGPLIVILGLSILGCDSIDRQLNEIYKKIENALT